MIESMTDTHFTIVVPTRDRSDTLIYCLSTILSQDYGNFSVLVSDNASTDGTHEKVRRLNDNRIDYINTGRRVSMSENWEFALNHLKIKDGWVTILGDDDGLLPGALYSVNQIIKKTGHKAIRANGCSYYWPNLLGSSFGSISVSIKKGFEVRNSGQMLQKALDGKISYIELPVLYNGGFISGDLIEQARHKCGKVFNSLAPDIITGIIFSFLTEEYVYSYEPLAINGASVHSTGTSAHEKTKRNRAYDPLEKYLSESNIPYHKELPLTSNGTPLRSIPSSVYEAFLQAEVFHNLKSVKTSKEKQLNIILTDSGPNHNEIVEWAKLFSDRYNIDLSKYNLSGKMTLAKLTKLIILKLTNGMVLFKVNGSLINPLQNVYQASMVAGFIKDLRPSIFQLIKYRLKYLINK